MTMAQTALDAYINEIRRYPVLSRDDEASLFREYRKKKTTPLRDKIFHHNMRMVVSIAMPFKDYATTKTLGFLDLVQEGNLALLEAIEYFDIERGVRFSSYGWQHIRWKIYDYIMWNKSQVKFSTTLKNTHKGRQIMKAFSFCSIDNDGDDGNGVKNILTNEDMTDNTEDEAYLATLIERLRPRDRFIIERRLEDKTCEEIGILVGITKQAVNMRVQNAIKKMQRWVRLEAKGVRYATQRQEGRWQQGLEESQEAVEQEAC